MKLSYLCTMLDDIAAISGKNDKIMLLRNYMQDETFRTLIKYMLDPYLTYGVRDFYPNENWEDYRGASFFELCNLLDALAERRLTGNEAMQQLSEMASRGVGRDLLIRILNKDPKAGFGIKSANEAWPGLLPSFPYMRCSLPKDSKIEEFKWENGVLSQIKADGMFVNINKSLAGDVTLMSRQGTLIPLDELGSLVKDIQEKIKPGTQTHGELMVMDQSYLTLPREVGNGMLNSIAQGGKLERGYEVICRVWDQIPLDQVKPKVRYQVPYSQRWAEIQDQLPVSPALISIIAPIHTRLVYSRKEAYQHYAEVLEAGMEGTVLKDPSMPWIDGTSKYCVKLKLEADCDLVVTAFRPGNGKHEKTFGAIVAQTADGLLEVGVSGFTDDQRKKIWEKRNNVVGSILTVKANMVMNPSASNTKYSLFLPRVVEFRKDKDQADTLEQVINQFEAAKQGVA